MAGITSCPSCGTRNRVPVSARGKPTCAACKAPLPWIVDAGDDSFDDAVASSIPVVVDLWAPWCGPCRVLTPTLEQLAAERAGTVKLVKVNVDQSPRISARYSVQSIPTLLLIVGGEVVGRQLGALPAPTLAAWIDAAGR